MGSATARGLPGRQTATTVHPACSSRLHNAVPTAPVGPVFDDAEDYANALSIGNLTPGQAHGVWVKRTVSA